MGNPNHTIGSVLSHKHSQDCGPRVPSNVHRVPQDPRANPMGVRARVESDSEEEEDFQD